MKSNRGYSFENEMIIINRELTKLDLFLRDFLRVLEKYSDYLVVSGFVSISTGRTRGTEDIDVLVHLLNKEKFGELFNKLEEGGFWCYQGDSAEEVYDYIEQKDSVRFAKKKELFPNIEFISVDESRKAKFFELTHPQKIRVKDFEFKIPPIEFEILYKELVLGGEKDIGDARHLRAFFKALISEEKFKEYESIIQLELGSMKK